MEHILSEMTCEPKSATTIYFDKAWIHSPGEGPKYNLFSDHMNSYISVIILKVYYGIFCTVMPEIDHITPALSANSQFTSATKYCLSVNGF